MRNVDDTVYVLRHPHGFIKIGIAADAEKRLDALQTGCPYELEYWKSIGTTDAPACERYLHRGISGYRVRGEWFDVPTEAFEALLGAEVADPESPVLTVVDRRTWEVATRD